LKKVYRTKTEWIIQKYLWSTDPQRKRKGNLYTRKSAYWNCGTL